MADRSTASDGAHDWRVVARRPYIPPLADLDRWFTTDALSGTEELLFRDWYWSKRILFDSGHQSGLQPVAPHELDADWDGFQVGGFPAELHFHLWHPEPLLVVSGDDAAETRHHFDPHGWDLIGVGAASGRRRTDSIKQIDGDQQYLFGSGENWVLLSEVSVNGPVRFNRLTPSQAADKCIEQGWLLPTNLRDEHTTRKLSPGKPASPMADQARPGVATDKFDDAETSTSRPPDTARLPACAKERLDLIAPELSRQRSALLARLRRTNNFVAYEDLAEVAGAWRVDAPDDGAIERALERLNKWLTELESGCEIVKRNRHAQLRPLEHRTDN